MFHIGDVLSVTTGRMLSRDGPAGVQRLLSHLTGATIFTHQIPAALEACRPHVLAQHPALERVTGEGVTGTTYENWLVARADEFGEWLELSILPPEAYRQSDPLIELALRLYPKDNPQ